MNGRALATARTYHDAWTTADFEAAGSMLSEDVQVEVPINDYPTKESFLAAVAAFGGAATGVELLSALGNDDEACLVYDMAVPAIGTLRVAEHFTVSDGAVITCIRQIHDTAPIRAAVGDR